MYDGSRYLLYAVLVVPALVVGIYGLLFVVAMGPTGWFVLAFLAIAAMATTTWLDEAESEDDATERTNCRACGAPNPVDAEACGYCDAPLADE